MEQSREAAELGERFDPWDESYLADPYPFFAEAREKTPIFYSPRLNYWVVTRYHDIRSIFLDTELFSAANVLAPIRPVCPAAARVLGDVGYRPVRILTDNDPPSHTRARRLASVAFTPRRVAAMEPFIRELVGRFLAERFHDGATDLVRDLAWDLPVLVLFRVLGVPDEDVPRVKGGSGTRLLFLWGRPTDDEQRALAEGMAVFWRYARELVRARMKEPKDDYTSALIGVRDGDLPALTEDEVFSVVVILLAAGHETTTGLLGNALRQILTHRETWERIRAEPALIPRAVEEVLRYDTPVATWRRVTTREADICGVRVPAGANIMMLTGGANRDPSVFENPETFDIDRTNANSHLGFGYGPHFCLGAPLAKLEARIVFEELTKHLPDLRLVPGQKVRFSPNTTFRAPLSLLAEWGAGGRT